jgi:predicted O-linked N-acetylglucosamine transferase (SPINDLY family)
MANVQRLFNDAVAALNNRNLLQAERLFREVLKVDKKHVASLNLLTIVLMNLERFREAEEFISRAVKLNQSSDVSFYNYGLISKRLNKPHQALEHFDKALRLKKNIPETWNNRGTILNELKRYQDAIADFEQAIALNPNYWESYVNKAKALFELERYDEAGAAYDKALALKPGLAEAWLGRGNISTERKRYDEALAAYDKALALKPDLIEAWLGRGRAFADAKRYEEALAAYEKALAVKTDLAEAWLGWGTVCAELKRYDEALVAFDKALAFKPDLENAWLGRGSVFHGLKRYDEALAANDRVLTLRQRSEGAWVGRGDALTGAKRYDEALAAYNKASALKPGLESAWLGRGNVFYRLKRYEEALEAYDKALAAAPDLEGAWLGRGNVYTELKRYDEALAAFDAAIALKSDVAEAWLGRANVFIYSKRRDDAFTAIDKALALKPDLAGAWLGRGSLFHGLKRYNEALSAFDRALTLEPDLAGAWVGRGVVLADLKRLDEAFAAYDKAITFEPDLAAAWLSRGNLLNDLKRHDESFAAYKRAFELKPDLPGAEGSRLYAKMLCCDWDGLDADSKHLLAAVTNKKENTSPWVLMSIQAGAREQFEYAKLWVAENCPPLRSPLWSGEIDKNPKIRIGYLSSDFCRHPVAYLIAGIFENHDRGRFEIFAFSTGHDDGSDIRDRLSHAFDEFIDVRSESDQDVADRIRELNIDVLIDLGGHTLNARTAVLAQRPAPVQVNYLGYAGTMGADFIDYIIADRTLIPPSQQVHYQEKIVYLPHSFMPHDAKGRQISEKPITRSDFNLPEEGAVFCCFNNAYKLNPDVFQSWMTIMKATDGSVLWLSELQEVAQNNLKKEARAAGVDPGRLVFAKRLASPAAHLARHQLADLFLDTTPYNAHTTASDALWAGLPVLTEIGETFAARVGASLLTDVGLTELIARSRAEYEKLAIELANDPARLAKIKDKLRAGRVTSPLFNTRLFTRHLEGAYEAMYRRYQAGLAPDHIGVDDEEESEPAASDELAAGDLFVNEVG